MSKQEHDKDEQRAPSGAGKGDAPSDASPTSTTDDTATSRTAGQRSSGGSESAPPSAESGADKKSAAGKQTATKASGGAGGSGKSEAPDKGAAEERSTQGGGTRETPSGAATAAVSGKNAPSSSTQDASRDKPKGAAGTPATPGGSRAPSSGSDAGGTGAVAGGGGSGKSGGKTGGIALVLVILLALVVLIGGWRGWHMLDAQQQRLSQVESNATAIGQLEAQLGEGDQQREQAMQSLRDELQQTQESVNQTVDKVLERLASEQEADPSDWLYAEVEYLLRLANQRLQLERDVAGVKALLQTADERLAQADNPALTPVRRAIQSELAALRSVPEVDRTGLYLMLMAQQEQLAQLPLEQDVEQLAAQGNDTSPVSGDWQQQLSRFGQELKELVVVRKHDQALEALLTPDQEAYLRQNLRLQLEQAQLALLQANPELYQASLEKATTLIEGYYDTGNQGVSESLDQLATLADKAIRPELPDISGSLQALRDFMERRRDAGSAEA